MSVPHPIGGIYRSFFRRQGVISLITFGVKMIDLLKSVKEIIMLID